jgi:hypothetical protein
MKVVNTDILEEPIATEISSSTEEKMVDEP